jgi:HlyD family secretion protein
MAITQSTWKKIGIGTAVVLILLTVAKSMGWLGGQDGIKVTAELVAKRNIVETVSANGKVEPEVELKITADVSGEITELYVKEGDVVKKGTLLCRINPEIYMSSLDQSNAAVNGARANLQNSRSRLIQAQSQLTKAEAAYIRNKDLFKDKVISASDFEAIQSTWEVAKAEVDAAKQSVSAAEFNVRSTEAGLKTSKENLNKTSIYAPVDGTISKLSKEKGERVVGTNMMEGTEILRIANLNEMEVSVDVSENDIVRVNKNDTADIEIDAYLGRKFSGIVTEVANSSNVSATAAITDQVTNFTVKIRILRESYADLLEGKPADFSPFRPGMSASVDIRTRSVNGVLSLPIQSVTTRDTVETKSGADKSSGEVKEEKTIVQEVVFVVGEDGKAKMKTVKTGIQDSQSIEIVSGLTEKDKVISGPYNAVSRELKEGSLVKVVTKEELFERDKKK